MRKEYTRGFNIEEMLQLRSEGWTTVALGLRYGKDHTTIVYHCLKHGVVSKPNVVTREREAQVEPEEPVMVIPPSKPHKYDYIFNEAKNPGKMYSQYLKESLGRPVERKYQQLFGSIFKAPSKASLRRRSRG